MKNNVKINIKGKFSGTFLINKPKLIFRGGKNASQRGGRQIP